MPITSSAKKALRASKKKRVFNVRRKRNIDTIEKQIKKLVFDKKVSEAVTLLPKLQEALDKAAKAFTITKNKASRKKSRLAKLINKAK